MLGKRARPPMKRTTSMTEFTIDLNRSAAAAAGEGVLDPHNPFNGDGGMDRRLSKSAAASPRINRRNSGDFGETAHFLKVCSLCNLRLIPGRDIYMYRGDTAFCSLECRQQQMIKDEKKDKCLFTSKKEATAAVAAAATAVSAAGETLAAV